MESTYIIRFDIYLTDLFLYIERDIPLKIIDERIMVSSMYVCVCVRILLLSHICKKKEEIILRIYIWRHQ